MGINGNVVSGFFFSQSWQLRKKWLVQGIYITGLGLDGGPASEGSGSSLDMHALE